MAEKILVALKSGEGAGEIVPYIEDVAKPGTNVVFLVQYPVTTLWEYIGLAQDHVSAIELGKQKEARMAMSALDLAYSMEEEARLVVKRFFLHVTAYGKRASTSKSTFMMVL